MEAYFDNAATTKVFPEVKDLVVKLMEEDYGNPSSLHQKGLDAGHYIKETKEILAKEWKVDSKEIVLTSGGTESNNLALIGAALANKRSGNRIITTKVEHASVSSTMAFLESLGFEIIYLNVDHHGIVDLEQLEQEVNEDTILVSVMYVNNEIGTVEPIQEIAEIIKEKNPKTLFHVDAIQAFGKYHIYPKRMGIDLMSVSGHKIHGPKGSGFLYVRDGVKISPIILGGGQQRGMRSGTENVPAIAGLGEAVRLIYQQHSEKVERLYALKQRLIDGLTAMEGVSINGINGLSLTETAPHIVSASFDGIKSEVMLHALAQEGVYVSSGSACSSNHPDLSGTLKAIGVEDRLLDSTLRFSFSVLSTEEEVDHALEAVAKVLPQLRRFVKK